MRVLFICTGNSARSQIAEALLRKVTKGAVEVHSAGSQPKSEIHPMAREAVQKLFDLDMKDQYPKTLDRFLGQEFDYVITVCDNANQNCPAFPGKTKRIHWSFDDPASVEGDDMAKLSVFRRVRDEIRGRLREFIETA